MKELKEGTSFFVQILLCGFHPFTASPRNLYVLFCNKLIGDGFNVIITMQIFVFIADEDDGVSLTKWSSLDLIPQETDSGSATETTKGV